MLLNLPVKNCLMLKMLNCDHEPAIWTSNITTIYSWIHACSIFWWGKDCSIVLATRTHLELPTWAVFVCFGHMFQKSGSSWFIATQSVTVKQLQTFLTYGFQRIGIHLHLSAPKDLLWVKNHLHLWPNNEGSSGRLHWEDAKCPNF